MVDNSNDRRTNQQESVRRSVMSSLKFWKRPEDAGASSRSVSAAGESSAAPAAAAAAAASSSAASSAGPSAAATPSAQQRSIQARPPSNRSSLANPSGPTRRRDPPPPYTAVASPGAAAPAPPPASTLVPAASPRPPSRAPSPARSTASATSRLTVDNIRSPEDPYTFLTTFDTIFVIDDSGSMAGSYWKEVQYVLANITPICTERDADGIDIYFLNHRSDCNAAAATASSSLSGSRRQQHRPPPPPPQQQQQQPRAPPGKAQGGYLNVTDQATVARIFQTVRPTNGTPTGVRLRSILKPYLDLYTAKRDEMLKRGEYGDPDPADIKPVNIIVITDGVPTDDLEEVLLQAAKRLDALDAPPYQVGVQFFQVGREAEAASYLRRLDDELGSDENVRDIVDTVTWDAHVDHDGPGNGPTRAMGLSVDGILKVVLGAVVKRLDRQPTGPSPAAPTTSSRRHLAVS